ncbi:MAG: hypothetical protein KF757_14365 [Phycisphaeraceae bacterium]|nr:hypothetical protein [Phycisphaeraceae bacterium]MCW5762932.1 hypothetical protein [Phycisphaeraceae bacterium]
MCILKRPKVNGVRVLATGLRWVVSACVLGGLLGPTARADDDCIPLWSALAGPNAVGLSGGSFAKVGSLTVFDDGTGPALYAGGSFITAGGVTVNNIARWDGHEWSALVSPERVGIDDEVEALTVFDDGSGPALYVGGWFLVYLERWDGEEWSVPSNTPYLAVNGEVFALKVYDDGSGPSLYAGGSFFAAGGRVANGIASWNGSEWSVLAGPSGVGLQYRFGGLAAVFDMAGFDDGTGPALYVAGEFEIAGGVPADGIARWDGHAWSDLESSGVMRAIAIYCLAAFDDGSGPALYAGGYFRTAGGVTVIGVARWDGHDWSLVGGEVGSVRALTVFDDGSGPALYAGGSFFTAGGVTVNGVARWDGHDWSALAGPDGVGVDGPTFPGVYALKAFDDGSGPALYAGGRFTTAGGVTVNRIARWQSCATPPCVVDFNNDGVLDIFDVQIFLGLYASGSYRADFTEDGVLNFFDVQRFLNLFATGCP